jgi:phosphoribosylformylglycinamidine synthase
MWSFVEAVRGLGDACRALETPIVSGNVSLYNETEGKSVKPTPTVGMVGLIAHANDAVGATFEPGSTIALLGVNTDELGGSEYVAQVHGKVGGKPPKLDVSREAAVGKTCRQLVSQHLIKSAHDCSEGGLAVALAECCLGKVGAVVKLDDLPGLSKVRSDALLFGEAPSRIIISFDAAKESEVRAVAEKHSAPFQIIGSTGGKSLKIEGCLELPVDALAEAHRMGFRKVVTG